MNALTTTKKRDMLFALNYDNALQSPASRELYLYLAGKFNTYMAARGRGMLDAGHGDILQYIDVLKKDHKPASVNNTLKALKRTFNLAIESGMITINPVNKIKYMTENPDTKTNAGKWLNEEQLQSVFTYLQKDTTELGTRNLAIVTMLTFTGLRASELSGVKITDIDRERLTADVMGKGRKPRTVEINKMVLSTLDAYRQTAGIEGDNAFYTTITGRHTTRKPMNRNALFQIVKTLGNKLNIKHLHPHNFRHTNITLLLKSGAAIHRVSKHAGHASIGITSSVYDHDDTPVLPYMAGLEARLSTNRQFC